MKIAIPSNEDKKTVCVSFGRTPLFLLVDLESGNKEFIKNTASVAEGGAGIKAAQIIVDNNVNALVTPRCGENASKIFNEAKIKIYKTTSNDLEDQINKFKNNKLDILTEIHSGFYNHDFDK